MKILMRFQEGWIKFKMKKVWCFVLFGILIFVNLNLVVAEECQQTSTDSCGKKVSKIVECEEIEEGCMGDNVVDSEGKISETCEGNKPHCLNGECLCSCERITSYKMNEDIKKRFDEIMSKLDDCSKDAIKSETDNFIINSPDGYADCIGELFEFYRYKIAVEYLGKELEVWGDKVEVKVTNIIEEEGVTGGGGHTPHGEDIIIIDGDINTLTLDTIPHELMHLIIDKVSGFVREEDWSWFEEGVTQSNILDNPLTSTRLYLLGLTQVIHENGDLLNFNEIFGLGYIDGSLTSLLYAQTKSMADYLLSLDKPPENRKKLYDFFTEYLKTRDLESTLKKYYGMNVEEFEKRWLDYIKKQVGNNMEEFYKICNFWTCSFDVQEKSRMQNTGDGKSGKLSMGYEPEEESLATLLPNFLNNLFSINLENYIEVYSDENFEIKSGENINLAELWNSQDVRISNPGKYKALVIYETDSGNYEDNYEFEVK